MDFTLHPSGALTEPGDVDALEVRDEHGVYLGLVAQTGGRFIAGRHGHGGYQQATRFRVMTAGPLVKFDGAARYDSPQKAARAIVAAREADPRHVVGEDGLSPFQRDVLDFEQKFLFVHNNGAKQQAIRDLLELTLTRYLQILAALAKTEAALAYSPIVVNRIRRQLEQGKERRRVLLWSHRNAV